MTRLLLVLSLTALACGTSPVAYVATPTAAHAPTHQPTSAILPTVQARWQTVHVTGCWNLRTGPGGAKTGEVACNRDLVVSVIDTGGWYESPLGWICGRAWGLSVKCYFAP